MPLLLWAYCGLPINNTLLEVFYPRPGEAGLRKARTCFRVG